MKIQIPPGMDPEQARAAIIENLTGKTRLNGYRQVAELAASCSPPPTKRQWRRLQKALDRSWLGYSSGWRGVVERISDGWWCWW